MNVTPSFTELIDELSPVEREATRQFIESLVSRRTKRGGTLRQDWAGVLRAYRQQYTALEWMSLG